MKIHNLCHNTSIVTVAAAIAMVLCACATVPAAPPGSRDVRTKLTVLKSEPALAARVPVALEQAERAVTLAETPQGDPEIAAHRVYLADRMIETARATAETRLAEAQRMELKQQSDNDRLAARTREADTARMDATAARTEADAARNATTAARTEADAARNATAAARTEADAARNATAAAATAAATAAALAEAQKQELARQIELLQGRTTERGIVLTLSDVLFSTGSANLKVGHIDNLDRVAAFMDRYADRRASIEGHTDSVGPDAYNQDLSQRRADSVKAYLDNRGVASNRMTSIGKGEGEPVADNDSATGRQQNRRVEVIIQNTVAPIATAR